MPEAAVSGPFVVLLVDDEAQVRNLLRQLLVRDGTYHVLTASSGEEALKIARQFPDTIDILITDIDMRPLNGIDLYRQIREERPDIRVLFISGKAEGFRTALPEAPLLEKPFPLKKFVATVRDVLGQK